MPGPLFGKTNATPVKSFAENALKPGLSAGVGHGRRSTSSPGPCVGREGQAASAEPERRVSAWEGAGRASRSSRPQTALTGPQVAGRFAAVRGGEQAEQRGKFEYSAGDQPRLCLPFAGFGSSLARQSTSSGQKALPGLSYRSWDFAQAPDGLEPGS